jgi:hypothetical protein
LSNDALIYSASSWRLIDGALGGTVAAGFGAGWLAEILMLCSLIAYCAFSSASS